jgi:hypothetical protein
MSELLRADGCFPLMITIEKCVALGLWRCGRSVSLQRAIEVRKASPRVKALWRMGDTEVFSRGLT